MAESKAHVKYQGNGTSRIDADLNRHMGGSADKLHSSLEAPMLRRALAGGQRPSVCIVGAGVSGLRAAEELLTRGFKVTIYEGRNRIGGRVSNAFVWTRGPNWIHGTDNNPILDIANSTNTTLHSWGEREASYDTEGNRLSEDETAELSEAFWSIVSDAFHISNEKHDEIPSQKSLWDFIKEQAASKFADESAQEAERKRALLLHTSHVWGDFVGSTVMKQSLKFFWLEECIEGVNPFVAGTYDKVLKTIAAPALKGADLHFNRHVDKIATSEGKVTVHSKGFGEEDFDEVIVTSPLGCLKQEQISFEPPLPARLIQAIDAIGYGCLDKVYISFPQAFWEGSTPTPTRQTGLASKSSLEFPEHTGYPGFTHFLQPSYATASNPAQWFQEMLSLSALPDGCAHPTLLFYIFGDHAAHVARLVAEPPPEGIQKALFSFFEPYFSRLPGYEAARSECQPVEALATAWVDDPLAGNGSYSCFKIGLEQGDKDIETLREGLPAQRMWFAGEHTAPFIALGTVTGAYWSGEAVAKRIVATYEPN